MLRFAANLSMMFTEHPFLDRFGAAAAAGFRGVEFHFPYEFEPAVIAAQVQRHALETVLFNLPPGDFAAGDRGLAAVPGREEEFAASVQRAAAYARQLSCRRVHAMAGLGHVEDKRAWSTYLSNLALAADRLRPMGVTVLIEAINGRDMPGYFLQSTGAALRALQELDRKNLRLLFDIYHCQVSEGDLIRHLRGLGNYIEHVQIASVPGRQEPDHGEVYYPALFEELERMGYHGWIGCEYRPAGATAAGLGWLESLTRKMNDRGAQTCGS